jgi:serine protease Do
MKALLGIALAVAAANAQNTPAPPAPPARPAERVVLQRGAASYLGIGVIEITPERAKALNLKEEHGAEVANVAEDSPAAKAGIKAGDVVLEYNGQAVEGTEQLVRMVRETPVGRQAKMTLWRNGGNQVVTVTMGERRGGFAIAGVPPMPPMPVMPDIPRMQMTYQSTMLGIEGEPLASGSQLGDFFGVKEGVLVKRVVKDSAADKAGIKAGDVITKVDETPVSSTREVTTALRSARQKKTFPVTVVRNKKEMQVTVTIEDGVGQRGRARADMDFQFDSRVVNDAVREAMERVRAEMEQLRGNHDFDRLQQEMRTLHSGGVWI